jgi:uncharacterized protein YukE
MAYMTGRNTAEMTRMLNSLEMTEAGITHLATNVVDELASLVGRYRGGAADIFHAAMEAWGAEAEYMVRELSDIYRTLSGTNTHTDNIQAAAAAEAQQLTQKIRGLSGSW